jgi:hypothetical protein
MYTENNNTDNNNIDGPVQEKKKLTDMQLRIVQGIAGLLSAAALIVSIYVSGLKSSEGNILMQYLFLIIFVLIIFGRRSIENKFRLRLNFYNLVLIDGILGGILIYFILLANNPESGLKLDFIYQLLIIIGIVLIIIGLGIVYPYLRYRKRKAEDKLIPIRIPEPKEGEEDKNAKPGRYAVKTGPSISSQIADMTKELEGTGPVIHRDETEVESSQAGSEEENTEENK